MYDGSLATVGPWEALVTFQQFIVLADREGFVDMTPEAISRRTIIPLEIIKKGIAVLEQPDAQSRDPGSDGRRIERIADHRDWGWKIINYAKYRLIRSADERREYMRAYMRDKQREKRAVLPVSPPGFTEFWQLYPRKVGKGTAEKEWLKISPSSELQQQILKAVADQMTTEQWLKDGGKYIPHPTTWLKNQRWLDEETKIDLGQCTYCSRPAAQLTKGNPHCMTPRCLDHAQGKC